MQLPGQVARGGSCHPVSAKPALQGRSQLVRPLRRRIDHDDASGAEAEQRVRDRRAGAARAEENDPVGRRSEQSSDEVLLEAEGVGIVTGGLPALEHNGVHGPNGRRLGRELVNVVEDELLVRMGDVQPSVSEQRCVDKEVPDRFAAELQLRQVDRLVEIPKAQPVRLFLVQGRGERRGDAAADQADQIATARC